MPTLPNPEEVSRIAPKPSGAVANYSTQAVGSGDSSLGDNITTLADAETKKLDALKADDAETTLMRKELELTAAYKETKGGDVLSPDYHKSSKEQYSTAAQGIQETLSTPAQKAQFNAIAKRRSVAFDAARTGYAVGEADQFETTQHEARVQVITDTATSQYANPTAVAAANAQLNDEVIKWGVKQGMSDPAIAAAYHKKTNGAFYNALIEQAIANSDTSSANTLFAASSRFLSPEQSKSIQNQLKAGNDYEEGKALAIEGQRMLNDGKSMSEVGMYVTSNAKTPGAYSAAQTIFTNFQQDAAKAQAEKEGSVYNLYHQIADKSGGIAAKNKILRSPEYAKLTEMQRSKAYDYMDADVSQHNAERRADVQFGWAAENHNDAVEARKDAKVAKAEVQKFKTPEVMAKFSQVITDPNLAGMSRNAIHLLAPEIGYTNVQYLLKEQEILNTQVKPLKLDADILNAAKPPELKKDTKTANSDAYDGFVKSALLDWQALHPNKQPSVEEQKAIARSANTEYNVATPWYNKGSFKAYEVPSNEKYATEAEDKRGIIQAAAARGITLTSAQVEAKYQEYKQSQSRPTH